MYKTLQKVIMGNESKSSEDSQERCFNVYYLFNSIEMVVIVNILVCLLTWGWMLMF